MNSVLRYGVMWMALMAVPSQSLALSFAPEEFEASRKLACVLAQQSLGHLTEDEYGAKTHTVLEGFDETERDNILAQAVGYYGGLMFSRSDTGSAATALKLEDFIASSTCVEGYSKVTLPL
jgi:hypothetical protein